MQNFGVTNIEHYGMLWHFLSGQLTKCFWSRKGLTSHDLLTRSTNGPFSVVGFCFNTYPKPLHRTSAIWWPYWTLWQPSDTGKHPQITSKQIPPDRSNESWLLQTHTIPIRNGIHRHQIAHNGTFFTTRSPTLQKKRKGKRKKTLDVMQTSQRYWRELKSNRPLSHKF